MKPKLDQALLASAVFVLLGLAWLGIKGGVEQWPASQSLSQKIQSAAQFGYGVFSILLVSFGRIHLSFAQVIRWCWLACLTVAGGLAPTVWGGLGWGAVPLTAVAALATGFGILWLLRRGLAA